MIEIPLGRYGDRGVALIDDCDLDVIVRFRWMRFQNGKIIYAYSTKFPRVMMHRLILGNEFPELDIDHINRNGLDNQRSNLRWCSRSQNCINRPSYYGKSKFKGVSWSADRSKWQTHIKLDRKSRFLGRYETELEAARAYDKAATELYGSFAFLNFSK